MPVELDGLWWIPTSVPRQLRLIVSQERDEHGDTSTENLGAYHPADVSPADLSGYPAAVRETASFMPMARDAAIRN